MEKEQILKRLFEAKQITFEELMILSKDINNERVVFKEIVPYQSTPYQYPVYPPSYPSFPYYRDWSTITCEVGNSNINTTTTGVSQKKSEYFTYTN